MILVNHFDPVEHIFGLLDNVFRSTASNSAAMKMTGLVGLSQKIIGLPGWNVWLEKDSGAYQIELQDISELEDDDNSEEKQYSGDFLIKYYPGKNEEIVHQFSKLERLLRKSDFFDHTGTPTFEKSEQIPANLYVVGLLQVSSDTQGNKLRYTLEAPNLWETVPSSDLELNVTGFETLVLKQGEPDRKVPGWDLSLRVFDVLIRASTLARRDSPRDIVIDERQGYSYSIDEKGGISEHENNNIAVHSIELSYDTKAHNTSIPTPSKWTQPEWWTLAGAELPSECSVNC